MKFYFAVLSLILFKTFAFSQTKFLKQFNFDNGNYAIYLIDCKEPLTLKVKTDSFNDTIIDFRSDDNFQVTDVKMLNQLKQEWVGKKVDYLHNCWYDYFIYVTENDSIVLKFEVNLDCKELIFKGNSYKIDPTIITKFLPEFKVLQKQNFVFENIDKGRDYWESILKNEKYVFKSLCKDDWLEFDGEFYFHYSEKSRLEVSKVLNKLNEQISLSYLGEKFELRYGSALANGNQIDYLIQVSCNKSLFDKFNLYPKKEWYLFRDFSFDLYKLK
jgi:hypothetical protein